jgi:hypothetical protein
MMLTCHPKTQCLRTIKSASNLAQGSNEFIQLLFKNLRLKTVVLMTACLDIW